MSSSTADIICGLRCVCHALNIIPTIDNIITCLKDVERSDSVFIDTPCMYMSRQQKIVDLYKPIGKIYCIYGLEQTRVETSQTHNMLISYYNNEKQNYLALSNNVRNAFFKSDKMEIINCSSISAELAQGVLPKKCYYSLRKNLKNILADGLIVAHTGSLIGYLYAAPPQKLKLFFLQKKF